MKIILIPIESLTDIGIAYKEAIRIYCENNENVWDAKIELKQINFEANFRRDTYECLFQITEGSYLYNRDVNARAIKDM